MKQILLFSLFAMIVCACNSDQASEPTNGVSTTETESKTQKKKRNSIKQDPKWVMAVDGLPELSGGYVRSSGSTPSIGSGSNPSKHSSFSLVSSQLTVSIVITPFGETDIRMTFREQKVGCANFRGTVQIIDDTRVELSGEVKCSPTGSDRSEQRKAQINGWFETKK